MSSAYTAGSRHAIPSPEGSWIRLGGRVFKSQIDAARYASTWGRHVDSKTEYHSDGTMSVTKTYELTCIVCVAEVFLQADAERPSAVRIIADGVDTDIAQAFYGLREVPTRGLAAFGIETGAYNIACPDSDEEAVHSLAEKYAARKNKTYEWGQILPMDLDHYDYAQGWTLKVYGKVGPADLERRKL